MKETHLTVNFCRNEIENRCFPLDKMKGEIEIGKGRELWES